MQVCKYIRSDTLCEACIPPENAMLFQNIKWGSFAKSFTPAYWKMQIIMGGVCNRSRNGYRTAANLSDEVCSCLLGGYGVSAEICYAAYRKLKENGLTTPCSKEHCDEVAGKIYNALSSNLQVSGRLVKYRFPKQKSLRIAQALVKLESEDCPKEDLAFRDWLLTFNGIGYKTASWITRNWLGSDKVAIIDIHIFRACTLMGLFSGTENISKEYRDLEEKFLNMARAMKVKPAEMDLIIWMRMREMGRAGTKLFNKYRKLSHQA